MIAPRTSQRSDDTVAELEAAIKEFADDFGYDLDEFGDPVELGGDSNRVVAAGAGEATTA